MESHWVLFMDEIESRVVTDPNSAQDLEKI